MKKRDEILDPARTFYKEVQALADRHQTWRVFSDFAELAALSLRQGAHMFRGLPRDEDIERQHARIMEPYRQEEREGFARLFACVVLGLEGPEPVDFLGPRFQELDLGNHWHGQFFTPSPLCRMMAEMVVGDAESAHAIVAEKGFVSTLEPCVGSGAMVIALAGALRARGIDTQRELLVDATDVDPTAAHMAYVQFTLLGIPAIVRVGNGLTLEQRDAWATLGYWMGEWRFRRSERPVSPVVEALAEMLVSGPPEDAPGAVSISPQLTLF